MTTERIESKMIPIMTGFIFAVDSELLSMSLFPDFVVDSFSSPLNCRYLLLSVCQEYIDDFSYLQELLKLPIICSQWC